MSPCRGTRLVFELDASFALETQNVKERRELKSTKQVDVYRVREYGLEGMMWKEIIEDGPEVKREKADRVGSVLYSVGPISAAFTPFLFRASLCPTSG